MHRDQAISKLARIELSQLETKERELQLQCMLHEDWSDAHGWDAIDPAVRDEFEEGELLASPLDPRYDPVLLVWLQARYSVVTTAHIAERLGIQPREIIGSPAPLEPCPCCGYRTLGARNEYEICPVCWWDDDGQDNRNADVVMGGPNYELSLTQGRINYLRHGISKPERHDLRQHQDAASMYEKGRTFVLNDDGTVRES